MGEHHCVTHDLISEVSTSKPCKNMLPLSPGFESVVVQIDKSQVLSGAGPEKSQFDESNSELATFPSC